MVVPALREETTKHRDAQNGTSTVLVVDDNTALLRSVDRLLRMEGYRVWMAQDGSEGLDRLEGTSTLPDLIISDIAMPGMDGFEFYQAVRQRGDWVRIPFVFLTARDQTEDLQTGYALGADDYLIKPLDQERLLMIVKSKIERSRELMRYIDQQKQALGTVQRELSRMVAHELRTPLVSITMISDMLARDLEQMETSQIHDMLTMMQSGSVRMHRLVEQMVLYVQLQSGGLAHEIHNVKQQLAAHTLLQWALRKAIQWDYRQRGMPVDIDCCEPDVPIEGEQISLTHVLAEVLYNAAMFTRPDTTVTVRQRCEDGTLVIAIADHGPGISAAEIPRVFEPFYQVNRKHFEQQGIGIGLTLTEQIVEIYGGSVAIESVLDKGTTVTLRLPVCLPAD